MNRVKLQHGVDEDNIEYPLLYKWVYKTENNIILKSILWILLTKVSFEHEFHMITFISQLIFQ